MTVDEARSLEELNRKLSADLRVDMLAMQDARAGDPHEDRGPSIVFEVHEIMWMIYVGILAGRRATQQSPAGMLAVIDRLRVFDEIPELPALAELRTWPEILVANLKASSSKKFVTNRMKAQLTQLGAVLWRARIDRVGNNSNPKHSREIAARNVWRLQKLPTEKMHEIAADLPFIAARFVYTYAAYADLIDKGLDGWPEERPDYTKVALGRPGRGIPGRDDPRTKSYGREIYQSWSSTDAQEIRATIKKHFG